MSGLADVGLIGLAVMGQNLVLNLADRGHSVAVQNRTTATTDAFVASVDTTQDVRGTTTLAELVAAVARPRRIILMVKAGGPVDALIAELTPLLDAGDILIDAGNSLFTDTERRASALSAEGMHFVGCGVSGGEIGARFGPSIMPGGDAAAWPHIAEMLQSIAATAGPQDDEPCCDWVGSGGAGHYVKMVHNGIEYGDMQVLAEAYAALAGLGLTPADMAPVFAGWNEGRLQSYLVEITAEIMAATENGQPLIDLILDAAGQKGTGKWTVISAMDLGQPVMLVAEAVGARTVSSFVELRTEIAREHLSASSAPIVSGSGGLDDGGGFALDVDQIEAAVYAAKLVSYAQGFMLLDAASDQHGWSLDLAVIARLWRAGCIIRAGFLDDIAAAFERTPDLPTLLLDPFFIEAMNESEAGLRATVVACAGAGIPVPAMASALSFYDGFRARRTSANLVQAQRDYFGAHTYERVDRPRGEWFHTDWSDLGAGATSGSYSA